MAQTGTQKQRDAFYLLKKVLTSKGLQEIQTAMKTLSIIFIMI
jgi:hypothetical protein